MRSLLAFGLLLFCGLSFGADQRTAGCYIQTEITGSIGPATLDLIKRSRHLLEREKCVGRLLLINTPGGNLQTTRLIVEEILNEAFPTLCLVYPAGAHAGSAGAIIMQACHLAGAVKTTQIGAASPVAASGQELSEDMRNKLFNDTRAWVEGLARLRSRSLDFARDIVDKAKAVPAEEALKLKAIDFLATSPEDFVQFASQRTYKIKSDAELKPDFQRSVVMPLDLRFQIMKLLMSPEIAYLIFMGSLGLLYFELTHPGAIAPGVIGGIGLIISLVSLHMLEVEWGAVALIVSGIVFMIAEAFVAGFGILGVGGIVAFFMGSLFLFDPLESDYSLPLGTILPTTILVGALMLWIAYLAFSARKRRTHAGFDDLLSAKGRVVEVYADDPKTGLIEIEGETWRVHSEDPLTVGQVVKVQRGKGLTLFVLKHKESKS